MFLLIKETTFCGSVLSIFLASFPTITEPSSSKNTTEGVVLSFSKFARTTGLPYSSTWAIHEYVVPKSIPNTCSIFLLFKVRH